MPQADRSAWLENETNSRADLYRSPAKGRQQRDLDIKMDITFRGTEPKGRVVERTKHIEGRAVFLARKDSMRRCDFAVLSDSPESVERAGAR
jgi:hypothetical protein